MTLLVAVVRLVTSGTAMQLLPFRSAVGTRSRLHLRARRRRERNNCRGDLRLLGAVVCVNGLAESQQRQQYVKPRVDFRTSLESINQVRNYSLSKVK